MAAPAAPAPRRRRAKTAKLTASKERYPACVNRDLLEDASVDLEAWMLGKVNTAYRNTISNAVISGTGVGMPG